jgi:HSP20 family protein
MARNPLSPFRIGLGGSGLAGDPFLSLHREVNRLFDDVFRGTGQQTAGGEQGQGGAGSFVTALMNVSETDKEIRVRAELPGVAEQDIDLSLDDDVLTIRGEKKFEQRDEKEGFHLVECSYGTFQRALRLPFPIKPEQVKARFENGVLTVTLPKTQQQERSQRIQIETGRAGQGSRPSQIEGERVSEGQQGSSGGKPTTKKSG